MLNKPKGRFNISVSKVIYNISVEFISFKTERLPNKKIEANTILGTIAIGLNVEDLDALNIIAERTTVEIK